MKIKIIKRLNGTFVAATISPASKLDMPLSKSDWKFSWKTLYRQNSKANFYKLNTRKTPKVIEGILMVSIVDNKMVFMNNVEIAPHNYGSQGKYQQVAECLIAFAAQKAILEGRGGYKGFLCFDSKTQLIKLYQQKYGAILIRGQRMYIPPHICQQHVAAYLQTYN